MTATGANRHTFSLIGQIAALLIALFCVLLTGWCFYDVAYLSHSPNDWGDPAKTDVILALLISVPGWLIALPLAIFVKPFRRILTLPTFALALVAILLWILMPHAFQMNKERQQQKLDALVRGMEKPVPGK